ncbi:N-6 DNA methylase [Clostridium botulinum]|uniref:HsdM family class I SAM-dependent methyltransferase n=1 Tax=Clostridium botulinum TaxID=1491 RepID=UPI0007741EDF|nr:N-6 DNA methylase [Clostridium botulinum]MBN1048295.1 N-6 DNA methylase [Clostridium botulinum]MBN1077290.1 N-6 DNA methylase [Clostridium botulinum]NFE84757.1 N-6 DNA methylase [Clostridium botulinum]NFG38493.1 N-6 DNA methylase [Clostridium botulinum]NFN28266.1 N-6 DNA methylase [Clostridium botulinum]
MKDLKEKVQSLGYKEINEIDNSTFIGKSNSAAVYVKKLEEGVELKPEVVSAVTYEAMELDPMPTYAWITNGSNNSYILVEEDKSISEIPQVVSDEQVKSFGHKVLNERDKWSINKYQELQEAFDGIHELIYGVKDHVNNSNDAIDEFCKLIFMEEFSLNHKGYILTQGSVAGKKLDNILNYETIENADDKNAAVNDIREAFKEIKAHPDYVAVLDDGTTAPIFGPDEYIKLENPTVYKEVFKALQDLGNLPENLGGAKATLADLSGDVLGRIFDVLLRGKYENKGGMGIYLTPRQVTEAATEIVIHDLTKGGAERIIEVDEHGIPKLRVIDGCCGSAGFIIKALLEVKNYLLNKLSGDKQYYEELFEKMKEHSFVGADASPGMILKARINMALHGANKCPIFQSRNSLMTENLEPGTFDVVLTNPPFSSTGVSKKAKNKVNEEGVEIIAKYSTDIDEDGQNKMSQYGLSLGSKPDSKGKWKEVNSIDPAVLFIDRYLQLLKPGGLCMMVVPDGILSNSGNKYVREYLMGKKNEVTGEFEGGKAVLKAVISLPQETFSLSGAGAKTSLLYFKKKEHKGEKQGSVFMAVADEVGFAVKNNVEIQLGDDHNDLLKIVEAYKKGMPENIE